MLSVLADRVEFGLTPVDRRLHRSLAYCAIFIAKFVFVVLNKHPVSCLECDIFSSILYTRIIGYYIIPIFTDLKTTHMKYPSWVIGIMSRMFIRKQ